MTDTFLRFLVSLLGPQTDVESETSERNWRDDERGTETKEEATALEW